MSEARFDLARVETSASRGGPHRDESASREGGKGESRPGVIGSPSIGATAGKRPLFSIVVPTFNRPELLGDCLRSIAVQSIQDFECIVVDDGSDTAHQVVPDDSRFRLVALEANVGVTKARQEGCEQARGKYVCFLDDDDLWAVDRLKFALKGHLRAPVAVCQSAGIGEPTRRGAGRRLSGNVHDIILDSFVPHLGTVSVRRDVLVSFDRRFGASQDIDWWLRQSESASVATVERVGMFHRRHSGPRNLNGIDARIRSGYQLLAIHGPYFAKHRRARAFRWYRLGQMHLSVGETGLARKALFTSMRARPTLRAARQLLRRRMLTSRVARSRKE